MAERSRTAPATTSRPELAGTFGMVATTHWLASAAGMAVLERGGNAFDAAAAAAFTLHVVEPHLNGPGGEVPIIFQAAGAPGPRVLCGQGVAPAAATADRFTELGITLIPGTGLLPATVPGAVGAWLALLRDYGSLPLGDVLDYAIGYAERGHPISAGVVGTISAVAGMLRTAWPDSAAQWLPDGAPPEPGSIVRNTALARTYRRLAEKAEAGIRDRAAGMEAARLAWYDGFVAEAVEAFCRKPVPDETGREHRGLLTGADMATWTPTYEETVSARWRGWTVHKAGAWSQGPVLLQQLGMLDALGELPPPGSAERVHRVVEVAKLAFADREAWFGDEPDVPLAQLLDPAYLAARAAQVGETSQTALRPGGPGGREPRLPRFLASPDSIEADGMATDAMSAVEQPEPNGVAKGDTCHIDVVDRHGNMVSATPSGGWLQSSPYIPEIGFCLGTRAQMFWLEQGLPNSLAPGKRPRTTLSPSFAVREDSADSADSRGNGGGPATSWAFGTPGGDQQDQWQLLLLLGHVADGLNLQAAIDAPAWHSNDVPSSFAPRRRSPGEVVVERRIGRECLDGLRERGHRVTEAPPWSLGRLSSVTRDAQTGVLRAAANPRGMQGYAAGR